MDINRRDFLKLAGIGGAVLVFGPQCMKQEVKETAVQSDFFFFVQLSDTHWGFSGPKVNPDAAGTLQKAIASVNSLEKVPDFVVFTGDITHTTDDPKERRKRMKEAREIIGGLKVKDVKFLPGEHDASLDNGIAFKEYFGNTHYTFDHKGVHFIAIDNVSDPTSSIGDEQLQWLGSELGKLGKDERIVILTHRPLFDLYQKWDWWTKDGDKAVNLLMPYKNVTVLYGHIHQENHKMTGHIPHHSAKSLIFPLPAPGSVPKRLPIPWDAAEPYKGMGFRGVESRSKNPELILTEFPVKKG